MLSVRKSGTRLLKPFVYKHTTGYYAKYIWGIIIPFVIAVAFPAFFLIHSGLGAEVNMGERVAGCICLIFPVVILLLIPLYAPEMKKAMRNDRLVSSGCTPDSVHHYKVVDCVLCTKYEGTVYELRHLYTTRIDDSRKEVQACRVSLSDDSPFCPNPEDFNFTSYGSNSSGNIRVNGLVVLSTYFRVVLEDQDEPSKENIEIARSTDVPLGYYIRACWIGDKYYLESTDDELIFGTERV